MADSPLLHAARQWVFDNYPYNRVHLLRTLEWLDRINPGITEAARLAALTHDMERAFPGPDQPIATSLVDPVYYRAHSERSARIVGAWLVEQQAEPALVNEVTRLIEAHEFGGWEEADWVQAADSLSFLETNVDLFLNFIRSCRYTADDVRTKFRYTVQRIRIDDARRLARPLLLQAEERLTALERSQAGVTN